MTHKQRFGHVNATNRNSYLNIICIKIVRYTSGKNCKKKQCCGLRPWSYDKTGLRDQCRSWSWSCSFGLGL